MRVTGGQRAIGRRERRTLFERDVQRRYGIREPMLEEMSHADPAQMESPLTTGVETHRALEMLDRHVWLPGEHAKPTAPVPPVGKARIERECPVNQGESSINVFAEASQHHGGAAQDPGVVGAGSKGLTREIDGPSAVLLSLAVI